MLATMIGFGCLSTVAIGDRLYAITNGDPDSTHTGVGTMVFDRGDGWFHNCSGSLISPTVFLTAGHCIYNRAAYPIGVTFEQFVSQPLSPELVATIIRGTGYYDPAFSPGDNQDPHDLGVIVLQTPVTDRRVSRLPSAGLLDQLDDQHMLGSQPGDRYTWKWAEKRSKLALSQSLDRIAGTAPTSTTTVSTPRPPARSSDSS